MSNSYTYLHTLYIIYIYIKGKSPTSVSHTGRTTTMESTHTSSDYGKAPVFTGEAYGTRKDNCMDDKNFVMYSKHRVIE